MKKVGIFLLFFSVMWNCSAAELPKSNGQSSVFPIPAGVRLVPRTPEIYVINQKDSLNDILSRFVLDHEKLLSLWGRNLPQYSAGDAVSLLQIDNKQQALQFKHGRTVKLSPNMRIIPAERTNNLLPLEKIQQFLMRPRVVTEEELRKSAYIISGADKNLLLTSGMQVYARGLEDSDEHSFVIIRPGQTYRDPVSNEPLAREAIYLGDAELKVEGDPSTLLISNAKREIQIGDRLLPLGERTFNQDIKLHSPKYLEGARIIAVVDGVTQIGQYQVVVINKGLDEDMEIGHVLAVKRHGGTVQDTEQGNEVVTLPSVNAGTLLIFKVFDRISYAVILKANQTISVLDEVTPP